MGKTEPSEKSVLFKTNLVVSGRTRTLSRIDYRTLSKLLRFRESKDYGKSN